MTLCMVATEHFCYNNQHDLDTHCKAICDCLVQYKPATSLAGNNNALAHYEQSRGYDQISYALYNIHGLYCTGEAWLAVAGPFLTFLVQTGSGTTPLAL